MPRLIVTTPGPAGPWLNLRPEGILVGGDKAGQWVDWYEVAIPTADAYYDEYLRRHP